MRGIAEVSREAAVPTRTDAFIGSLNGCTEIITQIGNVIAGVPVDVELENIPGEPMGANRKTAKFFVLPGIGFNHSKDIEYAFCRQPFRFHLFLHLQHKESEKISNYVPEEAIEPMSKE